MPKSAGYVSADYLREVARLMRSIKERSYEMLRLSTGSAVLDVGCGPGADTVPLAKLVAPGGRVVGIDLDEEMVAQAKLAAAEAGVSDLVEHTCGNAGNLSFPDATFDGCRAERLLQVLPTSYEPRAVVAELARVVRSGGRVVIADTDWASASVDFSNLELERRLMALFALRMRPNGLAGRQLLRLLADVGCAELELEVFTHVTRDFDHSPFGDWLRREAIAQGVATPEEMDTWSKELGERTESGIFFCTVAYVVACGVVRR